MARAVPSPWAAEPSASPRAMLLLMPRLLRMNGPTMPPKMPTTMTTTAAMAGMPPDRSAMLMAIGVVTDLGSSEATSSWSAPNQRAISTTLTMPIRLPTNTDVRIDTELAFRCSRCSCNRYPRATTVGPSRKLIIWLPRSNDS